MCNGALIEPVSQCDQRNQRPNKRNFDIFQLKFAREYISILLSLYKGEVYSTLLAVHCTLRKHTYFSLYLQKKKKKKHIIIGLVSLPLFLLLFSLFNDEKTTFLHYHQKLIAY